MIVMLGETSARGMMNAVLSQTSADWKGIAGEFPAFLAPVCTSVGTVVGNEQVSACPEPSKWRGGA